MKILLLFIAVTILFLSGCATEYYPPQNNNFTKLDGKIRGAVKREGFVPWSDGVGKNLPLANPSFSVIGK